MSRIKRILALTICLLMTITSLPVTQLVFADTATDLVVLHEDTFTSADEITWTYKSGGADYISPSVDANGDYVMTQIATSGAGTTTFPDAVRDLNSFVVEESVDDRTEVVAGGLNGKYTYEIDLEALLKKNAEASSAGYASIYFNSAAGISIAIRVGPSSIIVYDGGSTKTCAYIRSHGGAGVWQAADAAANAKLKITLDTTTGEIESYFNGELMDKHSGTVQEDESKIGTKFHNSPIRSLTLTFLSRMDIGSYIKFKEFKITQHSNAADATLSALPTALVADVNGATETSVALDSIDGVTWASVDESAATVSGNTLTLLPSTTGTKEATVTATFTHNGIEYVKTYKMTLAKGEEVVTPEPTPTPTEGVVSVDKTFNYASAAEALADRWKLNANDYIELAVDENGYVKYNQIKQGDVYTETSTGSKVYKANSSGTTNIMYNLPAGVVAEDIANGTKIINETGKYMGKLKLEVDVEMDMKPATAYYLTEDGTETGTPLKDGSNSIVDADGKVIEVPQSYFNFTFAPNLGVYRMRPDGQKYLNNGSEKISTIKNSSNKLDFTKGKTHKLVMTFDTVGREVTGTIEGAPNVATGSASVDKNGALVTGKDYLLQLQLAGLQRMEVGSSFTIKSVKLTTEEASYGTAGNEIVAALPAKLGVADINNVTEATVTLPEIDGVTWTSVDETAATIAGNTVTFIPSTDGTKKVEIKASFTGDTTHNIKFSKYYTMTLAEVKDVLETEAPGTLVDSHGFSDSDVPGRKVYHAYTASTNFSGEYTTDGFVLSRASDFASGTGAKLSDEFMRINLTKKVEDEYEYGLKGKYAIDLTVNGKFKSAMGLSDVYLDGYMVSSGNPDSLSTSNDTNVKAQFIAEMGRTGNTFFQLSSASDSTLATERAPIPVDTDTVIRLIVDSVTGDIELYSSVDNKQTFTSYGSLDGVYNGDSIQGFIFNPGLGLRDYSTMTFKNIDIYEISAVKNTFTVTYYVDSGVYKTVTVEDGATTSEVSAPVKTGYVFDGWYLDGASTAFDFTTAITADTQLYAKYVADANYDPTVDGVVAFDKVFNYENLEEAEADGWTAGADDIAKLIIKDGKPYLDQIGQKVVSSPTATSASTDFAGKSTFVFPAGPVSADIANRTQIIAEDGKYTGIVKIDINGNFDMGPSDKYTYDNNGTNITVNASYNTISLQGNETAHWWRVRPHFACAINGSSEGSENDIKVDGASSLGGTPKNGILMSSTTDTVEETVSATLGETGSGKTSTGTTWAKRTSKDLTFINKMYIEQMERLPVGSYSQLNSVKLTVLDPKFGDSTKAILEQLPDTLDVRDVNNVTERQITLPDIAGVTWSSTSANVTIEDGVASLKREKGKTVEVTIKGTFTADDIKYSKEYAMTLAEDAYTITYYDIDGEFYQSAEVKEGGNATSIEAPTEENYSFIGWYEEDAATAFNFDTVITGDVNLYAKYEGAESSVVFMANGSTVTTLTGKFGGTVQGTIPAIPPKTGYTAVGWYVGDTDEVFNASTLINSTNMVVNAKYIEGTLDVHTVTFKVDGEPYATSDAVDGYALTTVPADPAKENYTFAGWTLDGDLFDLNTPVTSNITLDAKFTPNEMSVRFFMDDTMSELYTTGVGYYGSAYGTLPTPVRDTYIFLGWKNSDGTDFTAEQIITKDISVYATWESAIKVILDEDITAYTSLTGNSVEFFESSNYTDLALDGKGVKAEYTSNSTTDRSFGNEVLKAKFKIPLSEADTVNRTQVYNNKLVGDYEVSITMDVKLSGTWGPVTTAPYGRISTGLVTGTTINPILMNRINASSIQAFNNSASNQNTFNNSGGAKTGTTSYAFKDVSKTNEEGAYTGVTLHTRYNSVTKYAEMYMEGNSTAKSYGSVANPATGINGFYYGLMGCEQIGDFVRVSHVKVTQYSPVMDADYEAAMDILDKLPASIVAEGDDPYNVTKDLNIPVVRGVTWTSSDKGAADASTGVITKWYDPQEVVITAVVNVGNFSFSKEYKLTIEGDTSIVKSIIVDETFASAEDMENWTFASLADGTIADYSVDGNGVHINKTTAPEVSDNSIETKRYFAYYDLYTEAKSDTYTTTSTKDVNGVYDVTINVADYVATSTVPVNVGIGYRKNTTFYPYGSLVFNIDGAKFTYNTDREIVNEVALGTIGKDSVITVRIDNILGEVALFVDGELYVRTACYAGIEGTGMINTVRAAIDVNNEMGDGVTIKGVKVEKLIANHISALDSVISAADSLTINTVTSNPDSLSGTINVLPEEIGGYKVDWKSSSNQIDLETREVFHDTTANTVVLTAEVYDADATYPVVARKTFKVTVRAAADDAELGQFYINSLGRITNQSYDDIRYDLNLPEADNVSWTSSNTDIIGNDGLLNDTVVLTEATPVTITATSNGVTKDYNLTVAPRTAQVNLTNGNAPLAIKLTNAENAKISSDVTTKFTYKHSAANTGKVSVLSDNGDILVSMVATETGIYFDYKNSDYKEIALADGESASIEILVMPDVDKVAIFVDGVLAVDYADLKTAADYVASVDTTNAAINTGVVTMTVNKYGMLNANLDNFDYFADVKYGYANAEGINLPTNVISSGAVTWTSSNTSLLANNGTVTQPEVLTYADLEFKIADKADSRIFISKNFKIAVDCSNANNIISGIVPTLTNLKDHTYPERNSTDNDITTAMNLADANKQDSEIIFNLGTEKTFNSMFIAQAEAGIEDFVIYTSSDGSTWTELATGTFGDELTKFVEFDTSAGSQIKVVAKQGSTKDIKINEIKVFLSATEDELALIDLELITVPATAEGATIALPETGVNGTKITWTSSNEDIIDAEGNVTRPSTATTVTLTATVMVDGEPVSKEFEVYVDTKANTSGPSQVGGGSGGGGGAGGMASGGATTAPVIGENTEDTVYAEDLKPVESETDSYLYKDVKSTDWYYEQVKTLTNEGIVSGDGTGYFYPTQNVTREQFVKMILEAIDVEIIDGETSFVDVVKGAWYEDYIATAQKNIIVKGLSDTEFGIGSNITRQDMAVLIERVLTYKNIEVTKSETEPFADADQVSTYAAEAVANMKAMGLIQGYNNMYNPKDNLTRAEAATVIASLLELLAK